MIRRGHVPHNGLHGLRPRERFSGRDSGEISFHDGVGVVRGRTCGGGGGGRTGGSGGGLGCWGRGVADGEGLGVHCGRGFCTDHTHHQVASARDGVLVTRASRVLVSTIIRSRD